MALSKFEVGLVSIRDFQASQDCRVRLGLKNKKENEKVHNGIISCFKSQKKFWEFE